MTSGERSPELRVLSYKEGGDIQNVGQIRLNPADNRLSYVEAHLPAKTGEHWNVFSGDGAGAVSCSTQDLAPGSWELKFQYWLEYPGGPSASKNASMTEYYCYEGDEAPFFFPQPAMEMLGMNMVQEEDILCVGPFVAAMGASDTWEANGIEGYFASSMPTTIQLGYHIVKPSDAYTFEFQMHSDLPHQWHLYLGDETGPTPPAHPIQSPWTTSMDDFYLWAVGIAQDPSQKGQFSATLELKIRQPADVQPNHATLTTIVWVGEWQSSAPSYRLYFPMMH